MIYVGIDVSSKSFVVHAVNDKKRIVFSGEILPTKPGLSGLMKTLGPQTKRVVFEAGNQMKWMALWFTRRKDVHLHVVHPNEIKWIGQSDGKTDKIDARKLAELARADMLPRKVHVVQGKVRKLRELLSARQTLQGKRVALCNSIRSATLQEGQKLPEKFFTRADWAEALEKKKLSATLKLVIESYRHAIDALKEAETELTDEIVAIEDERIEQLESIPSIGPLTSRILLSALDDVTRFDGKKQVANYGALTPRIYQSGNVVQLGRINRDGRQEVRRMLLQCAHTLARMKSYEAKPLREFFERIEKRRGKKIAIVALARKLLTIAYGVLKQGSTYDPEKLKPSVKQPKSSRTYRLAAAR